METVWERRRLKRETLEPEDMHTERGGGVSAPAWLGPLDMPDTSSLCPLCPFGSSAHQPRHSGHSHFTAIYPVPALARFCTWACSLLLPGHPSAPYTVLKYSLSVAGPEQGAGPQRENQI